LSNHSFTYIKYDNIDLFKLLTDFFLELINIFVLSNFVPILLFDIGFSIGPQNFVRIF
jgi:hypothetical protein